MRIITKTKGGVIQSWEESWPVPENCAIWPDDLDTADFYAYNGFVALDIEDGVVIDYTPDIDAWEAATQGVEDEPTPENGEPVEGGGSNG